MIDTATNTVVATVLVGSSPLGVTASPDGSHVYVANSGPGNGKNTVSVIDTATNTVTTTVAVGTTPYGIGTFVGPICRNACDDSNPCTDDACNIVSGCSHTPNTGPCPGDGLFCDGVESCSGGTCVSPGNPCAGPDGDCAESCDDAADACTAPDPTGSACADGTCNGLGTYVVATTSTSTTLETTTTKSSSSTSTSTTTETTSTTETTNTTVPPPCAPTPVTTCQLAAARRAAFQLRCSDDPRRTQLTWRWTAGEAVMITDRRRRPSPPGARTGRPCWRTRGTGYHYGARDLTPDGLWKLQVNAGDAMRAKILVKGKGTHRGDPAPPLASPVTVQLMRGDGAACWEAVFTRPVVNDQGRFNARSD